MGRVPINNRLLRCDSQESEYSVDSAISLSDTVFEFLSEEFESSPVSSFDDDQEDDENENGNGNGNGNVVENDSFWETQHELLKSIIRRTSSFESKIQSITKEALTEAQQLGNFCSCGRSLDEGCRKCLMEEVCRRILAAGFDCAICESKWKSSPEIPSGEHTFLDVVDNSNTKRGEMRVIIELNFRAEFEMARANDEYNKLVKRLPEIYVGKIERLMALLKILCSAAKQCMKENKMHMGPWRKHRYMQAKWLRTCERRLASSPPLSWGYSSGPARPKISMLTVDLMKNISNLHRPIVAVV